MNSAWTVQVIRGLVLGSLLIVAAPLVGGFFGEPRAILIIRVLGLAEIIKSSRNIGVVYFKKELEFHKQFFYRVAGTFGDLAVALPLAFLLRSVWALVFGLIAKNSIQLIVSYFIHDFRPKLNWDVSKIRELFDFGRWIWGSSIVLFLLMQGDDIFVGKYLGSAALGLYQLAYRISNTPATEITRVISKVTFPAYSKLQDKLQTLRKGYFQTMQLTLLISLPLAAGIAVMSYDFVNLFLGEKWIPMVPAMQTLAIFGAIRAFNATTGPLFQAKGRPEILTKVSSLQLIVLAAIIFPLTATWGILGTSVAVIIPNILAGIIAAYKIVEILETEVSNFVKKLGGPLFGASFMLAEILIVKMFLPVNLLTFFLLIMTGAVTYFVVMYILELNYGLGYRDILSKVRSSL